MKTKSIRPLWKLASEREVGENTARRTRVYTQVHEDSSTVSTMQFSSEVAFRKRSIFTLCVSLLMASVMSSSSFAKEVEEVEDNKNPLGCRNVGYEFDLKTLHLFPGGSGLNQSLYFIYNAMNEKVNLYQMLSEESSRSLYLNHTLNPHQWAALATGEKIVKFICTVPDGNKSYGKIIDCGQSLQVCEFAETRFGLNNRGNYWVVKGNTKSGAVRDVVHYGIIPQ